MAWGARSGFLRKFGKRGRGEKRHKKAAQRQAFESKQAVWANELKAEATSLLGVPHDKHSAKGRKGEARMEHKFPTRTHGEAVVTLSTAGRARISLKHGLGAPNPDDLISLPPVLFYPTECIGGKGK